MRDASAVWSEVHGGLRLLRLPDRRDLLGVRWRLWMKRLLFFLLASCYASVSYHPVGWGYWGYGHSAGAFSTSYGSTGIVWNQPQGVPAPHEVVQNDTPVEGSDGTFGWKRTVSNADAEIHRVSTRASRRNNRKTFSSDASGKGWTSFELQPAARTRNTGQTRIPRG